MPPGSQLWSLSAAAGDRDYNRQCLHPVLHDDFLILCDPGSVSLNISGLMVCFLLKMDLDSFLLLSPEDLKKKSVDLHNTSATFKLVKNNSGYFTTLGVKPY